MGAEARLQFRPNGAEGASYEVRAAPGSMYLMRGPVRWSYQHQVVSVKTDDAIGRYFTFGIRVKY